MVDAVYVVVPALVSCLVIYPAGPITVIEPCRIYVVKLLYRRKI